MPVLRFCYLALSKNQSPRRLATIFNLFCTGPYTTTAYQNEMHFSKRVDANRKKGKMVDNKPADAHHLLTLIMQIFKFYALVTEPGKKPGI